MSAQTAYTEKNLTDISSIPQLILYTLTDFIAWWYVSMPIVYIRYIKRILVVINDRLSITFLIKTFGAPWKRDKSTIGLFMGIAVRIIYIPIALITFMFFLFLGLIFVIIWLAIPLVTVFFIFFTVFLEI